MRFYILLVLMGMMLSTQLNGQDREKYVSLIDDAWASYQASDYLRSGQTYNSAFRAWGDKGMVGDRYNAACSWALAGLPDSAFVQLFRIAKKGNYTNLSHISVDPDLESLRGDSRWDEVITLVTANKEIAEEHLNKPLVAILDTVFQEDQKYRMQIDQIEKEFGMQSEQMQKHWELIMYKDSINLIKVTEILDEHGWLGVDELGRTGNSTLFLVIQHADLATQEKYLPMMRDAVEKGNANASSLALLEDRVALRNGEKQIYGSQVGRDPDTGESYVLPLEDPDNVDARRASVGLGPLKDYVSRWGIEWDPEEYKKLLPAIEAKQRH